MMIEKKKSEKANKKYPFCRPSKGIYFAGERLGARWLTIERLAARLSSVSNVDVQSQFLAKTGPFPAEFDWNE